jgi:hypothetical protein
MRFLALVGCCGLLLLPAGCGGGAPKLAPVRGQVFYRGQPLAGGTIVFTPDPERGGSGPLACGEIGGDGRYTLRTAEELGAVPGWHRVTVAPLAPAPGAPPVAGPLTLPRKYSDPEQSGQDCEVKAGLANVHDFHLE